MKNRQHIIDLMLEKLNQDEPLLGRYIIFIKETGKAEVQMNLNKPVLGKSKI